MHGWVHRMSPNKAAWALSLPGRRRAFAAWLAIFALLGNVMLPAAVAFVVSVIEPDRGLLNIGLCRGGLGDLSGKTKPGVPEQHCLQCMLPAGALPRLPNCSIPDEVANADRSQPRTAGPAAPFRYGGKQARAPPSAV